MSWILPPLIFSKPDLFGNKLSYMDKMHVFTVSVLTRHIKMLLEENFPALWVEGEVSNFKPHHSGHLYFTLKDAESQIACVMWRNRAESLGFELKDGTRIRVLSNLKVYEKAGRYQLDVLSLVSSGIGELQIRFEQLKQKLAQEGLFDKKYKKEIPSYPDVIGVITSPTGAAVKDIMAVLKRRAPSRTIVLYGVKVQGEGAAEEIAAAIRCLNRYAQIDVLIVGRGGGSLEDLWPFNEEIVARGIFDSTIPVVSAVGHEIDFTIADFVADLRAPTPSAAAEMVAPDENELRQHLQDHSHSIYSLIRQRLENQSQTIKNLQKRYGFKRPQDLVSQYSQHMDELSHRLLYTVDNYTVTMKEKVNRVHIHLKALNPRNVLERGYSLLFREKALITSVHEVAINDVVEMKLKVGQLQSRVLNKSHD